MVIIQSRVLTLELPRWPLSRNRQTKMTISAFISYSWETAEHRNWIRSFASRLRLDGVDARIDQWQVHPGDDIPRFMEDGIRDCDYVLLICTPEYRSKAD